MVLDLMEKKEQGAAKALSHRLREKKTLMEQLQTLEEFRSNYSSGSRQVGGKNQSPGQLQEYQMFMANINSAISDQKKALQQLEPQLRSSREVWQGAHLKTRGFQTFREQAVETEQNLQDKREQTAMDDKAGRRKGGAQSSK